MGPERRQISSWHQAELNARDWMRAWGYKDARLTAAGADGGVDVQAAGALAQVKFEAKQVGRPQLQLLVGARGRAVGKELLFFTGAGYSVHALEYAESMDIALFHYSLDGRITAVNGRANAVSSGTAVGRAASEEFDYGSCLGPAIVVIGVALVALGVWLEGVSIIPYWVSVVVFLTGILLGYAGIAVIYGASRERNKRRRK